MFHNDHFDEKSTKTAILVGALNIAISPLLIIDSRIGVAALVIANSLLTYYLHEFGKSRRPGSNALNSVNTFFAAQVGVGSNEVENKFRNIINGGAAVCDEFVTMASKLS